MVRLLALALATGLSAVVVAAPPDDKLPPPTAKELKQSATNLKHILLAFHNYESANGKLPNNVYSKDGKPMLSWRAVIVPYLQTAAKEELPKVDESWDSDHNKKLIAKMPKVFAPVRVKAKEGETFYRGFEGKGAPFGPDKKAGLQLLAITDGTANTGMVFEAAEPVVWTKPEDLPFDPKKPLPKLGGLFDGVFHVALADGSVHRFKKDPPEKTLRVVIGYQDGEVFDLRDLLAK